MASHSLTDMEKKIVDLTLQNTELKKELEKVTFSSHNLQN